MGFIKNLQHVGALIRSHHERYDGQGYPDELSDEEIPIGSRIIAVADAYDKIIHLKSNTQQLINEYIKASQFTQDHLAEDELLHQAVIHHLKTNAFSLYDPDIVKVFLAYLNVKGVQVRKNKSVSLDELEEGMTLTRSLYTSKGRFLLPHNTILTREHIEKLNIIHRRDPIPNEIFVRKVSSI